MAVRARDHAEVAALDVDVAQDRPRSVDDRDVGLSDGEGQFLGGRVHGIAVAEQGLHIDHIERGARLEQASSSHSRRAEGGQQALEPAGLVCNLYEALVDLVSELVPGRKVGPDGREYDGDRDGQRRDQRDPGAELHSSRAT